MPAAGTETPSGSQTNRAAEFVSRVICLRLPTRSHGSPDKEPWRRVANERRRHIESTAAIRRRLWHFMTCFDIPHAMRGFQPSPYLCSPYSVAKMTGSS